MVGLGGLKVGGHLKSTSGSQLEREKNEILEPGKFCGVFFQQKVVAQPIVSHFDVLDVLIQIFDVFYGIITTLPHVDFIIQLLFICFYHFPCSSVYITLRPLWIGGFAQPTKPPKSSSSEA